MNDLVSMRRSSVFNFQQIPHIALASLLLTLNNITHWPTVLIVNFEQNANIALVSLLST